MLYVKQKINISSLILSRGMMPLHQFFSNDDDFNDFRIAEEKEEVKTYFEQRGDLSAEQRNNAIAFYDVLAQTELIDLEIAKEIMLNPNFDQERWSSVQDKGIIAEYHFIQRLYDEQKIINGQKILQLFARSINLRKDYSDSIIALDKNLDILRQFDELPPTIPNDKELEEALQKDSSLILGEAVVKRIDPNNFDHIFDINQDLKGRIFRYLYRDIINNLILDSNLSKQDIERMVNNHNAFIEYVGQQFDEPHYPAFIALAIDGMPDDYYQTPEYVVMLGQLGLQYKKSVFQLTILDHTVLIKIFEATVAKWDLVLDHPERIRPAVDDIANVQIIMHRELATSYLHLWEWEDAILNYKEIARIAQRHEMQTEFDGAIIGTIDCLEKSFQYKRAIDHCLVALAKKRTTWKLAKPIFLSQEIKIYLDTKFFALSRLAQMDMAEVDVLIEQYEIPNSKMMLALFQGVEQDTLNSNQLEELQKMMIQFQGGDNELSYFDRPQNSNELALNILEPMGFFDSTIESYETQLTNVEKIKDEISPSIRLLYDLHRSKLGCLKNDSSAVSEMEHLLPKMDVYPKIFGYSKQGHWYNEFIRAMRLFEDINDDALKKIEHSVGKAIDLHLMNYIRYYQESHSWIVLQGEWENTYKAILINIESCPEGPSKQSLFHLLWNVLLFSKQAFHKYIGNSNLTIPDERAYEAIQKELNSSLWNYYSNSNPESLKEAKFQIKQLETAAYPHFREKDSFTNFATSTPRLHSILYHLFLKKDERRKLLTIRCSPDQFEENKVFYTFAVNARFEDIENYIAEEKASKSVQWNAEGILSLLSDPDKFEFVANSLTTLIPDITKNKALDSFINDLDSQQIDIEGTKLNLYCDQFLHEFPFEMIHDLDNVPYGVNFQMASVLKEGNTFTKVDLYRGIGIIADIPALTKFTHLKYTSAESKNITQLFQQQDSKVTRLNSDQANKVNLVNLILEKRPAILHLAVHGIADNQLPPATAALVLAPNGADTSSALLSYHEVINWDLSFVDLVVLSACNSSVGRMSKGSPIQGMAYAFLAAGASCVVASRIKVSDEKTLIFMNQFYKELINTQNVVAAMQTTREYFYQNIVLAPKDIAAWGLWT